MRNALNSTLDQLECPSVILRAPSSQKNGGAFNTVCVCGVCIYIHTHHTHVYDFFVFLYWRSTLKFIQTVSETRETHLGGLRGQQLIAGANSY